MPDPLDYLTKKTQQVSMQFRLQYPEMYNKIQLSHPEPEKQQNNSEIDDKKITQFSLEEHQSIMQKMSEISRLPAGKLDTEFELYLEQQLSDMIGFSITAELSGRRLLHSNGTLKSLPHQKKTPTDFASEHTSVSEAGFSPKRSLFGWINPALKQNEAAELEKFSISLPFFLLPGWSENYQQLMQWYRYRKVLLVNPIESCAVVAAITDVFSVTTNKYQFGGSPELIRTGKFWSPQANGKALVFFISDEDDYTPLGPVDLHYTPSTYEKN